MRRSHGKERPSLPRAGELRSLPRTGRERSEDHTPGGRFLPGNQAARNAGPKRVITAATSTEGLDEASAIVARDTRRLHLALLREVAGASESTILRSLAYSFARESALSAYYDSRANKAGLDTVDGLRLAERASFHRQRAERLSVTMIAEARALSASRAASDAKVPRTLESFARFPIAPTLPQDASSPSTAPDGASSPVDASKGRAGAAAEVDPDEDGAGDGGDDGDDEGEGSPNPGLERVRGTPATTPTVAPALIWHPLAGTGSGLWLRPGETPPTAASGAPPVDRPRLLREHLTVREQTVLFPHETSIDRVELERRLSRRAP